jgi:DMSO/TMAO reductase YedYZ molybdopterin-dependent catalytic subunit
MKRIRLFAVLIVLALLLSACATASTPTPGPAPAQPPAASATSAPSTPAATAAIVLKLEGPSGTKTLTLDEVKALAATTGWAGIKSSTGKITVPEQYKGVALDELCKQVGGISPNTGVNLAAKDGYAMTVSYDQITKGDFTTYDPGTGDELKTHDPLTVIIAYERGGKPLPDDTDGPLKLVVVSAKNNQVVDGHWSVKWIKEITIKSLAQEWKLPLAGAITEDMDRGTFQSCAALSCHGQTWTDGKAQVWTGVPLWLLAGRVDDEVKHGDGAYNDKLADQGYQVHVVAVDGYKVALESARIKRDNNILVAYLVNGNPLDDKDFPLRLVGSDLQSNEMVGRIAKINLMLGAAQPTATPKPSVVATPAPAAGNAALTITGAVDKPQTLTMDALKAMQVVKITADHPKKGKQDYEGVRLSTLLDLAQAKSSAAKLILYSSDGFTTEVAWADLHGCADCMLAFNAGKLDAVMPGMQSNFWAKDVVKLEVK